MNRVRADFVLLTVALIWGSAFAVQRVATQYFEPFTFNGLRFVLGGLILLPFSRLNPWNKKNKSMNGDTPTNDNMHKQPVLDRKSIFFIVSAGVVLFAGSNLQQAGLKYTTAGNAGFITTLYVIFVPIILVIFFKEKIGWIAWLGAGIAITGSLLLSTGGTLRLAPGDSWEMAGAVMWALDVIMVSRAVKHMDVLTFSVGHYLGSRRFMLADKLVDAGTSGRIGRRLVDDPLYRLILHGDRIHLASPGTEICATHGCDDPAQHGSGVCCAGRVYFPG